MRRGSPPGSPIEAEARAPPPRAYGRKAVAVGPWPASHVDAPEGSFVVIEGAVLAVARAREFVYANFGQDHEPRHDAARTRSRAVTRLDRVAASTSSALAGRRVRARGYLVWNNGPMLEINHPLRRRGAAVTTRRHFCLGGACCAGLAAVSLRTRAWPWPRKATAACFMTPEQEAQIGKQQNERGAGAVRRRLPRREAAERSSTRLGNRLVQVTPMAGQQFHFTDRRQRHRQRLRAARRLRLRHPRASWPWPRARPRSRACSATRSATSSPTTPPSATTGRSTAPASRMGAQVLGGLLGGYFGGQQGAQLGQQLLGQAGRAGLGVLRPELLARAGVRGRPVRGQVHGCRRVRPARHGLLPDRTRDRRRPMRPRRTVAQSTTPSWLQSHPRTPDRVARVASAAAAAAAPAVPAPSGATPTCKPIDGVLYGEDPKEGDGRRQPFRASRSWASPSTRPKASGCRTRPPRSSARTGTAG